MNKRGLIGAIVFWCIVILFISIIFIMINLEDKKLKEFCQDNGFESYEKGLGRLRNHLCIKVEDGYRVEKEFDNCGKIYCFIRDDDANVVKDEVEGKDGGN